ncbi:MAG: hypothetical protein Q4E17_01195 [Synergistes sp.]|nr:hypothetical protein [Synergistes sp.]
MMKRRNLGVLLTAVLTVFVFATIAIGMIDITGGGRKSAVVINTWIAQSRGAGNADRGALVAQKTKIAKLSKAKQTAKQPAKKASKETMDPQKALASLANIDKEKMNHYKTINGVLSEQKALYEAQAKEKNDTASAEQNFGKSIENAKASLKELRRLTDEQIKIYKATTNDAQAIKTAEATYSTWASAVSALSVKPLEDSKLSDLDKKVHENANSAVVTAEEEMKTVSPADVSAEDKAILKDEVIADGGSIQNDMQSGMQELATVFNEIIKVIQSATSGKSGGALGGLGGALGLGGGSAPSVPFDANVLNVLQTFFNLIAQQMVAFNDSFGGFMQSAGTLAGVSVEKAPALTMPTFNVNL